MVTFFVFVRFTNEGNGEKIPFEKSLFDLVTFFKVARLRGGKGSLTYLRQTKL